MGSDERSEPGYDCLWRMRRIDDYWGGTSNKTVGEVWTRGEDGHHNGMHPIAIPVLRMKHDRKTLHQIRWEISG
jgi:hypothetical protein